MYTSCRAGHIEISLSHIFFSSEATIMGTTDVDTIENFVFLQLKEEEVNVS